MTGLKALSRRFVPTPLRASLAKLLNALIKGSQQLAELAGFVLTRKNDYYSPVSPRSKLRANLDRWNRPSLLKGVEYNLEEMKSELVDLLQCYGDEFAALPNYTQLQQAGFGPGYTAVDALTLYMMVRRLKPKRYLEVGSGLSTYYCSLAAQRNADEGHPLAIMCIEPYPSVKLRALPGIQLISKEAQAVELAWFQQLQAGDILFIDSSHVLKVDGDVPYLYLEVLPTLNPGVVIHIHDVPFPYNIPYPPKYWVFESAWPMLWNEAMMLQAFLCFNPYFKIRLSTPLIRHFDEVFLKNHIPIYQSVDQNPNTFSSLWMQRIS